MTSLELDKRPRTCGKLYSISLLSMNVPSNETASFSSMISSPTNATKYVSINFMNHRTMGIK